MVHLPQPALILALGFIFQAMRGLSVGKSPFSALAMQPVTNETALFSPATN
jgi:hypothetical protein